MEIFLSHSSKDIEFCEQLASDLQAAGIKVWYAGWSLDVGDSLTEKLAKEVTASSFFGIVLSPDSVISPWVRYELRTAMAGEILGGGVKVLPLLYRKCEIPEGLVDKVYLDFGTNYAAALRSLLRKLGAKPIDADAAEFSSRRRELADLVSAVDLGKAGKPEEALKLLKRAYHLNPDNPAIAMLVALNYQQIGNRSKAIDWSRKAVDSSSRFFDAEVFPDAARVALWAGEHELARDFLLKGVEVSPEHPDIREMLADVFLKLHDSALAKNEAERLIALRDSASARLLLGRVRMQAGDLNGALAEFRTAAAAEPGSAAAHFYVGLALHELGRLEEAEPEVQSCVRLNPDEAGGFRLLAGILHRLKRSADEVAARRRIVQLLPNDAGELSALGFALLDIFEFREAALILEDALRRIPRDADIMWGLARAYFMRDDRMAVTHLRNLVRGVHEGIPSEDIQMLLAAAEARVREGRDSNGTDKDWAWKPDARDVHEFREKWDPRSSESFPKRYDP